MLPFLQKLICFIEKLEKYHSQAPAANRLTEFSLSLHSYAGPPNAVTRSRREYHYFPDGSWRTRELPVFIATQSLPETV